MAQVEKEVGHLLHGRPRDVLSMGCWSTVANFMDHDEALPLLIAAEWDQINFIFEATTHRLFADKSFHAPTQWLPHVDQFENEAFLAVVGLGYSMTRGSVLGHKPHIFFPFTMPFSIS